MTIDEACRLTSVAITIILVPLLGRILAQSGFHLLFVTADVDAESKLLPQDFLQRASVSDVDPLALSGSLLVVHALTLDCPVEALGSGQGRRQPDLLVRWLLVEHVCAVGRESNAQDAGLSQCQLLDTCVAMSTRDSRNSRPPHLLCLPAPALPSRGPSPGTHQTECGTLRR